MKDIFKFPRQRYGWLLHQIKQHGYSVGAEVGCRSGKTSSILLQYAPLLTLYCVDLWEYKPEVLSSNPGTEYATWDFETIKKEFDLAIRPYKKRAVVLQGVSWEMAERVDDGSLDFVFIDADHGYESVKKDIAAWAPKLKPGGLLSGHDIHTEGVLRAVKELVPNYIKVGVGNVWFYKKEDHGV